MQRATLSPTMIYSALGFALGATVLSPALAFVQVGIAGLFPTATIEQYLFMDLFPVLLVMAILATASIKTSSKVVALLLLSSVLGTLVFQCGWLIAFPAKTDGSLLSAVIVYGPLIITFVALLFAVTIGRKNRADAVFPG